LIGERKGMRPKTPNALFLLALAFTLAAGVLGCKNPVSSRSADEEKSTGSLKVAIGASSGKASMTIVPPVVGSVTRVVVTATSGATTKEQIINGPSGTASFAGLEIGSSWSLSAIAYAGSAPVGSGSSGAVTIGASITPVVLAIAYTGSGTTGDLDITISWPVSSGVDYLLWNISSYSGEEDFHSDTPTGPNWSARIPVNGLSPGGYTLTLAFRKDGTAAGSFVEAVNIIAGQVSSRWIDSGGTVRNGPLTIDPGLFFNSGTALASISFTGATMSPAFSPTITSYHFSNQPSSFSFSLTAGSAAQTIAYTWGGAARAWDAGSTATQKTASALALNTTAGSTSTNNLVITVTAPDGTTTKKYSFVYPYISGAAALAAIADDLSASYTLTADIATSGTWMPIGGDGFSWTSPGFTGTFDGQDHTISVSSFADMHFAGIFGIIASGGTVKNVHVDCQVTNGISSRNYVGALAGYNDGTILRCRSTGILNVPGGACIGGLVGQQGSYYVPGANPQIAECYSTVAVSGGYEVGGLVGGCGDPYGPESTIRDSYARGNVTAANGPNEGAGGLVGDVRVMGRIERCYAATAALSGGSAGGIAGGNILTSPGTASFSYYDGSVSLTGTKYVFGIEYTTAQMKSAANYAGWDFASVWAISPTINNGYPYLRNVAPTAVDTTPPSTTMLVIGSGTYATSTTITISFNVIDDLSGVTGYYIGESPTPTGYTSIENTGTTERLVSASYTLSATEGAKTIYACARDAAGNVSAAITGTTTLDTTGPTVSGAIVADSATGILGYCNSGTVIGYIAQATPGLSGVPIASYQLGASGSPAPSSGWVSTVTSTYLGGFYSDGGQFINLWVKDAAGLSNAFLAYFVVDRTTPIVGNVLINSGATVTSDISVSVEFIGTDALSGVAGFQISESPTAPLLSSGGWVIPSGTTVSSMYTFQSGTPGTKTIYVHLKDGAGNLTTSPGASITYSP
jgi:hypothetical protein